jgi:ribosomal protein S17E
MSDETIFEKLSQTKREVNEIAEAMIGDEKRFGSIPRFGYFSIPYPSNYGDRYYSQERSKVYRSKDKKVVTEPRGIYTKNMKSGIDGYFSNDFKQNQETLKRVTEMAEKERKDYIALVKNTRKK